MPELPGGRGNVLPASPIQGTDQSSAGVTGQSKQVPLSEVKASGWFGSRPTLESNQCSLFSYSARLLWFCLADYHLMTERLLALYKAAMWPLSSARRSFELSRSAQTISSNTRTVSVGQKIAP